MLHKVTPAQYLMGREVAEPITELMWKDMAVLLFRVNSLLAELPTGLVADLPNLVSSGYRPPSINKAVGGAPRSGHLICQAVDLIDKGDLIDTYLLANPGLLVKHNLWLEHPSRTLGWCHLDTKPRSARIFMP